MNQRTVLAILAGCTAVATVTIPLGISPAGAAPPPAVTVYDMTVSPQPGNLFSIPFQSQSRSEFGQELTLAGSARTLKTVTVTMSSFGCENGTWTTHDCVTTQGAKFTEPIRLNIYAGDTAGPGGTVVPGPLVTSVQKTFSIPYRPTANLQRCNGPALGQWWDSKDRTCNNGKAVNITYAFGSLGQTLPDTVVLSVAYNTTDHGYAPVGPSACSATPAGCGYDALNVALRTTETAPSVGAPTNPGTMWQNTSDSGSACYGTALGVFNEDSPVVSCWFGAELAVKITAD